MDMLNRLSVLENEVYNCIRTIKLWVIIAEAKTKHINLQHESLWWWIQVQAIMPLVAINATKIHKDTSKYINSIVRYKLTKEQLKQIKKHSQIDKPLKKLGDTIASIEDFRNKRCAHIEDVEVQSTTCNFQQVFICLHNISISLGYVRRYLERYYLPENSIFDICLVKHLDIENEDFLNDDHVVIACSKILERLHNK